MREAFAGGGKGLPLGGISHDPASPGSGVAVALPFRRVPRQNHANDLSFARWDVVIGPPVTNFHRLVRWWKADFFLQRSNTSHPLPDRYPCAPTSPPMPPAHNSCPRICFPPKCRKVPQEARGAEYLSRRHDRLHWQVGPSNRSVPGIMVGKTGQVEDQATLLRGGTSVSEVCLEDSAGRIRGYGIARE